MPDPPTLPTVPFEIRLQIYTHVLTSPYRLIPRDQDAELAHPELKVAFPTSLLQTSKQVYQEACPLFYALNQFHLTCNVGQLHVPNVSTINPATIHTLPFPKEHVPSLRRLSIQISSSHYWPDPPPPGRELHESEIVVQRAEMAKLIEFISLLAAAQATLAVLSVTMQRTAVIYSISWTSGPSELLRDRDPEGKILDAVGMLKGLGRLEIWKERSSSIMTWNGLGNGRWESAGEKEVETVGGMGWKGVREVQFGRRRHERLHTASGVAEGVAICFQEARGMWEILQPGEMVLVDGLWALVK